MSTKITKASENLTKRQILAITTRDDAIPMKDVPNGTVIDYEAFVQQTVTKDQGDNATGEIFESILVLDRSGALYATRSETFMRKLYEILELLADDPEPIQIKITQQKSRKGNMFVSCALA